MGRHVRRLLSDSVFIFLGGCMNCVSCDICMFHLWFGMVFSPGIFLPSRVTGAYRVTTDLMLCELM